MSDEHDDEQEASDSVPETDPETVPNSAKVVTNPSKSSFPGKVTLTPEIQGQLAKLAGFPSAEMRRILADADVFKGYQSAWQGQAAKLAKLTRPAGLTAWEAWQGKDGPGARLAETATQMAGLSSYGKLSTTLLGSGAMLSATKLVDTPAFKSVQHTALSALLEAVKASDARWPSPLAPTLLPAATQLSKVVLSDSAFTQWRAATGLHASIDALAKSALLTDARRQQFEDLSRLAGVTEGLARMSSDVLGSRKTVAARPMVELESYAGRVRIAPVFETARLLWPAGNSLTGLSAHDAFVAITDPDEADELASTVETRVVAPWEAEANAWRSYLYERLDAFDPGVTELLRGAWDSVARPGPADVVKVGACAVEAVIRALRAAAPDEVVMNWVGATGRRVEDFVLEGKVTRKARVRYLLRERKGDVKVVEAQADALSMAVEANQSRLQAAKHASKGDLAQVRAHLVTAESLLTQLFAFD